MHAPGQSNGRRPGLNLGPAGRRFTRIAATGLAVMMLVSAQARADEDYAERRGQLVEAIRRDVADTRQHTGKRTLDERVMTAMGAVPRHEFVPDDLKGRAYLNRPLPIGHGQTISQPYIVALMSDMLEAGPGDRVLEIGTGSGYQAAVLDAMGVRVRTIEIIEPLHEQAAARLQALGYADVETRLGDGYHGWPEQAPFDAIVVTAAASHIPPPLVEQLAPGGVMVIPVGARFQVQQLTLVEKAADGQVTTRQVLPVRFVPLTGQH